MRVLFLSWWWPYPVDNGSKIRIYNLLRQLSQHHEVTLLSFAESHEATSAQIEYLRTFCAHVEAIPKPQYNPGTMRATLGYLSPWPRSLVDVYSPQMAKRVTKIAALCQVDVVIASQLQTLRYLELVPELPAMLEEIELTGFYDRVEGAADTSSRFRAQLTLNKLEKMLRNQLHRNIALTIVSQAEQEFIRRIATSDAHICVIPNGVDTQLNRPDPAITPQPDTLIYSGAITYQANYDAVTYFIQDVLPLVRQHIPHIRFTITGGTGERDIRELAAQPGVIFSGYLPSVADAVRQSWALVTPLRVGGGTRLKILEAMALGTPVISTSKGAQGLNIRAGQDILLADTPEAMAEAVVRLLRDAPLRDRLSQGGRALVESTYEWSVIGAEFNNFMERFVHEWTKI